MIHSSLSTLHALFLSFPSFPSTTSLSTIFCYLFLFILPYLRLLTHLSSPHIIMYIHFFLSTHPSSFLLILSSPLQIINDILSTPRHLFQCYLHYPLLFTFFVPSYLLFFTFFARSLILSISPYHTASYPLIFVFSTSLYLYHAS